MQTTKTNKVLDANIELPSVPRDEEYHFPESLTDIQEKGHWPFRASDRSTSARDNTGTAVTSRRRTKSLVPHGPPVSVRNPLYQETEKMSAGEKRDLSRGPIRHQPIGAGEKEVLEEVLRLIRTSQPEPTIPTGELAIQMLLNGDISPDIRDSRQNTMLHVLVFARQLMRSGNFLPGDDDIFCLSLRTLVALGVAVDAKNSHGSTVLLAAIKGDWLSGTKILLDFGANVNEPDVDDHRPLFEAITKNNEFLVDLLLEYGAFTGTVRVGQRSYTALHLAARCGSRSMVSDILRNGVDVNARDFRGQTPLHWTTTPTGRIEIAELLLQSGVDVEARDKWWLTALDYAVSHNSTLLAKLLSDHGANPGVRDKVLNSPRQAAAAAKDSTAEVVGMFDRLNTRPGVKDSAAEADMFDRLDTRPEVGGRDPLGPPPQLRREKRSRYQRIMKLVGLG